MGNASLLLGDMSPGSKNAEFADAIVRASERAANLTRQLLAYAGKGRFMMKPVDCSQLVREISSLISASIPKKVKLQWHFHDQLPAVLADVIGVANDDRCGWADYRYVPDDPIPFRAHSYPRPLPGPAQARNFQGPSFASAHISALLALLIEKNPGLTISAIQEVLAQFCQKQS